MRDRAALVLKIICIGLAVLLIVDLVKVVRRVNPLANVAMPGVPSLPADTNAPPAVAGKPPVKPGTNTAVVANSTNGSIVATGTNAAAHKKVRPGETNTTEIAAAPTPTNMVAATNMAVTTNRAVTTNLVINPPTNVAVTIVAETNPAAVVATKATESNAAPVVVMAAATTNASGTNLAIALPTNAVLAGSNITIAKFSGGTNLVSDATRTNLTNSAMAKASGARPPNAMSAAMMGGPGGKKPAALPPEIQARVDRVYESEIFAPVNHPMPMALLGIAGQSAFLRAPSGQTGLVKEGEELGEIKLLRIGINRVLVEQDGKKQELMIFAGLGGESLLPKSNETSDETTKH